MSDLYGFAVAAMASYVLGSLPGHVIAAFLKRALKRAGLDPRRFAAANRGLAKRLLAGAAEAPAVFVNASKGILAVSASRCLLESRMAAMIAGVFVSLGHLQPFLGLMQRQRGVAVAVGAMLPLVPLSVTVLLCLWCVSFALTRYVSVSWVLGFGALPLILYLDKRRDVYVIYGVVMSAMAVIQMAGGLARISEGKVVHTEEEPFADEENDEEADDEPVRRKRTGLRIAAALLAVLTAVLWFGNKYVYRGFGLQVGVMRSGSPGLRMVALTFDDGPDPDYTPRILDILREKGVPATFFMVGKHVERFPGVARRVVEEGHAVGNHTYSHANMPLLTRDKIVGEVTKAEQAIVNACGVRPHLFRPPRGLAGDAACELIRNNKYTIVLWDLSSMDWAEPSYREIVAECSRARNGNIILFHDGGSLLASEGGSRENTIKALPVVIDNLRRRGFRFVTVDE
ncbi:MAG: glycerol-3-phosphate acyltransferase, partial [Firmicutes bacterium]|nr:glycerol-3-phosphate acyltransferase [Bacillota bacterium]